MKIISIIATIVISGLAAAEPDPVAGTEPTRVDWWLRWDHPRYFENLLWEHPRSIENIPTGEGWTHLTHKGLKIAVLIGMDQTDGESNIPVSAYLYNRSFKEWRRFMTLHIRNAYVLRAAIDEKRNALEILGAKYSPLEGKTVAFLSLEAVSDDRAYADARLEAEQNGGGQPATRPE